MVPLSPLDRKIELIRRGIAVRAIARELGYSPGHVSEVLRGLRRHVRTEEAIAKAIGRDVHEVFPPDRHAAVA